MRIIINTSAQGWSFVTHGQTVSGQFPLAGHDAELGFQALQSAIQSAIRQARFDNASKAFDLDKCPKETVEEFLARGGKITKVSSDRAPSSRIKNDRTTDTILALLGDLDLS